MSAPAYSHTICFSLSSVDFSKPVIPHLPTAFFWQKDSIFKGFKLMRRLRVLNTRNGEEGIGEEDRDWKPKWRWIEIGSDVTKEQKEVIDRLSPKLSKRCLAVLKQVICFSPERWSLEDILASWAKIMKPRRTDWLLVLKKLKELEHPLYFEVAELALLEESFEPHIRDYTKIIHGYGKANRLQDAENMMNVMNSRGFMCDQISLTAMIDMYSKAGQLKQAEEMFGKIKLLGEPLDNRTYGAMIMAYIRAEMLKQGEILVKEMDAQEIRAGSEIYKALLRAYSMRGDAEGAQRVFNALQIASIIPDVKICGLLINAYGLAGQSHKARSAFENMRRVGLEPNDKCVALVLAAYKNENKLNEALSFLIELEKEGVIIGKETSETLARWFGELGVAKDVELVLREFNMSKDVGQQPIINTKHITDKKSEKPRKQQNQAQIPRVSRKLQSKGVERSARMIKPA